MGGRAEMAVRLGTGHKLRGGGGGVQNGREGAASEFYPYNKREGGIKRLNHAKRVGTKAFGVVSTRKFKVLAILKAGGDAKSFTLS